MARGRDEQIFQKFGESTKRFVDSLAGIYSKEMAKTARSKRRGLAKQRNSVSAGSGYLVSVEGFGFLLKEGGYAVDDFVQ
jgi:hypothetical protein